MRSQTRRQVLVVLGSVALFASGAAIGAWSSAPWWFIGPLGLTAIWWVWILVCDTGVGQRQVGGL